EPIAAHADITRQRRLITESDSPSERQTTEKVLRIPKSRRPKGQRAKAFESREIPGIEVDVENRSASPKRSFVLVPMSPRQIRQGAVRSERGGLQGRGRQIEGHSQNPVAPLGILPSHETRERRRRQDLFFSRRQGDSARRQQRRRGEQNERRGTDRKTSRRKQGNSGDGDHPVGRRFGQGGREASGGDRNGIGR